MAKRDYAVSCRNADTYCLIAFARLTRQQAAVAALNTLQSNFSIVDAIRKSGGRMNEQAIPEMVEWCRKIGYEVCDFHHSGAYSHD